jgi:hypothetical protein
MPGTGFDPLPGAGLTKSFNGVVRWEAGAGGVDDDDAGVARRGLSDWTSPISLNPTRSRLSVITRSVQLEGFALYPPAGPREQ